MLGHLFFFYGRIGRLQFFLWSFIFVPLVWIISLLLLALLPAFGPSAFKSASMAIAVAIVPTLIFTWAELSLQSTRIRDIGWRPGIIVPVLFIMNPAGFVLGAYLDTGVFEVIVSAINVLSLLVFQFTPSKGADTFAAFAIPGLSLPSLSWGVSRRSAPVAYAPPPKPRQPSPDVRRPTYPGEKVPFGRRGLT